MKTRTVIYTRVSTDEQADKGFSLRHQKEMLERYCDMKEFEIVKHYQDDFSAKNFNRPEWVKLEAFVKANRKNIDKVIFTKWDRFSRNLEEALGIIRKFRDWGIEVNAIEQPLDLTNPDNKAMLALYLVLPEVENDKISLRTKEGIRKARKEGAYTSKPPFGYEGCRIDNKASMKPDKDAWLVKEMFNEVAKGIQPVEQIRKEYVKKGYTGCKQSFYYMLRNQLYIGKVFVPEYKKETEFWVQGLHEGIVDEVTFQRVQDVLDGKKKNARHPAKRQDLLPLRGFLKCPFCEENLTGSISKGNGGKYAYYHCRKGCKNRISGEEAHALFVEQVLSKIRVNSNVLDLFREILIDSIRNKKGDKVSRLEDVSRQISEAEELLISIEDKFAVGSIEPDTFNRMNKRYRERIMSLKGEYEEIKTQDEVAGDYLEGAIDALRNLNETFLFSDYEIQSLLLSSILKGKMYISKTECRTTELNKVVELLTRVDKGFKHGEKEKAIISDGLSTVAPPAGLEPATL